MPQMAPLWWTSLFMMFTLSLMMIMTMMHYQISMSPKHKNKQNKITQTMNWKW